MINNAESYFLYGENNKEVMIGLYREQNVMDMEKYHQHPQMEIFLILKGHPDILIDEKNTFSLNEGDILIFKSMEYHRLLNCNKSDSVDILTISFSFDTFLPKDTKWFDKDILDTFYKRLEDFDNIIRGDTKEAKEIKRLMLEMEKEFTDNNNKYVIKAELLHILGILLQHYDEYYLKETFKKVKHKKEIEEVLGYISKNLTEKISLEYLAKLANTNKTYFCALFKKVMNVTVWDYILNLRIELAISYLLDDKNSYSILEIANLSGFNNTANFNKAFKQITGKTPSEYKKSWGEM